MRRLALVVLLLVVLLALRVALDPTPSASDPLVLHPGPLTLQAGRWTALRHPVVVRGARTEVCVEAPAEDQVWDVAHDSLFRAHRDQFQVRLRAVSGAVYVLEDRGLLRRDKRNWLCRSVRDLPRDLAIGAVELSVRDTLAAVGAVTWRSTDPLQVVP